jgi:protein-S-isoprenylcysteine O-methyltransferase Ste14
VWARPHRPRTLGVMISRVHDALSAIRRRDRDWRFDLVCGLVVGLIAGVLYTLETSRSLWPSVLVWVGVLVAFTLVGGWIRRRKALGAPS